MPGGRSCAPDRVRVLDGPEAVNATQVLTGNAETAGGRPGGEQQAVVSLHDAVAEQDGPLARPESAGRHAESNVDVLFGVEGLRPGGERCGGLLTAEVFLRQTRALIGQMRLLADKHDPAVEPLLSQCGCGRCTGEAGSQNDDGTLAHR